MIARPFAIISIAILSGLWICAAHAASSDFPDFPDDDTQRALRVNDGDLAFLAQPPAKLVHHHHNHIVIDRDSLHSGWIALRQCHENLDVFERVEIVFDAERVTDLAVASSAEIGRAAVVGSNVQLEDVRAGARLCITLRSRALRRHEDGFELRNGPYMRKFLDGYYPMHVTMEVRFPPDQLRYVSVDPVPQAGFESRVVEGGVLFNAWFEGRLTTRVKFQPISGPAVPDH